MSKEKCCWGRCNKGVRLHYLTKPLCREHWETLCKMEDKGELAEIEKRTGMVPGSLIEALKVCTKEDQT
jgi:hypothetical protein